MSFCQCLIMDHMHVFGMFIVLCWSCFSWEAGLQCIIKSRWSCLCSCKAVSSFLGMCKTLVMPQCWLLETGYCLFIVLSVWPVPWQLLYWLKFSVVLSGGACSPPPPLLYLDSKPRFEIPGFSGFELYCECMLLFYMFIGFVRCSVNCEISRGTRKLVRLSM